MAKLNNYINGKELKEELHAFSHSHKVESKEIFQEKVLPLLTDEYLEEFCEDKIEEFKEKLFKDLSKENKKTAKRKYDATIKKVNWERFKIDQIKELKRTLYKKKAYKEANGIISEELGEMFLLLANNLASKKNFMNYTYKDEMIGRGVLYLCKYAHNFNKRHPKANAFAYVTQICKNGFLQAMDTEDKHSMIKDVLIKTSMEKTELDKWIEGGV